MSTHVRPMCAAVLEGYPVDPGGERVDQTSGYVGTVPLFEAPAGHRGGKLGWLMRRELP